MSSHVQRAVVGILAALCLAGTASAVQVSLPNVTIGAVGQTTVVGASIADAGGVEAGGFNFTYNSSIVTPTGIAATGILTGCTTTPNIATPGVVTFTFACASARTGSGALFNVTFQAVANGVSPLTFTAVSGIANGCRLNEGTPTCEPVNGQIAVGPPTATATASQTATLTATVTATATRTATATATDTATEGPTQTASATGTVTATASVTATATQTQTPSSTPTPSLTLTPSNTPTVSATPTSTATVTPTPIPTPRIRSGAAGGSTRVFGTGARNIAAPGIEIVAENGGQVIGTGGTDGAGAFTDGPAGIGLTRPLVAGERIFPRDTLNSLTGPVVIVGPEPPRVIPTLNHVGTAALGALLGLALLWRLAGGLRRTR